jgi:hypothetical protein
LQRTDGSTAMWLMNGMNSTAGLSCSVRDPADGQGDRRLQRGQEERHRLAAHGRKRPCG